VSLDAETPGLGGWCVLRMLTLEAVFLRILEYYSGILFLTTNRVGTFDGAFRSRIHLMLYYPKLTARQAFEIWKNNLKRIEEHNKIRRQHGKPEVKIVDKEVRDGAKKRLQRTKKSTSLYWNGRQIRNAFQTAVALAEFEAQQQEEKWSDQSVAAPIPPRVTKDHFERIAHAIAHFDQYITDVHGGQDEDHLAQKHEERIPYEMHKERRRADKRHQPSEPSDDEIEDSQASLSDDLSDEEDEIDDSSEDEKAKRKKKGKSKKMESSKAKK
jgi:hypothetical protein